MSTGFTERQRRKAQAYQDARDKVEAGMRADRAVCAMFMSEVTAQLRSDHAMAKRVEAERVEREAMDRASNQAISRWMRRFAGARG